MKRKKGLSVFVVCTLLLFGLAGMAWGYDENVVTFKAAVYPAGSDEKGNVTDASLLTVDGTEIFVVHNAVGDELLKLVEKNINVTGAILIDKDGKKRITVYKYEIAFN
ncbi:hypothetical protein [Candidatus Deferrimicrobium sp.]|uniref:hypothetical protein n=1 Tax=Candidatus Deferrimicrobium sp. TaxID=3060586 RepID=UPI003C58E7F6